MKQIKKLSLSNVIGKLTRNEMRYVMAGSGAIGCESKCKEDSECPGKYQGCNSYECDKTTIKLCGSIY